MKTIQIESKYHKKLKVLSALIEKQIQNLLIEALDLLFVKYEKEFGNEDKS
jgi:mRNA-degrading endonuclease RelE of RelBE toxin-antitoxin system